MSRIIRNVVASVISLVALLSISTGAFAGRFDEFSNPFEILPTPFYSSHDHLPAEVAEQLALARLFMEMNPARRAMAAKSGGGESYLSLVGPSNSDYYDFIIGFTDLSDEELINEFFEFTGIPRENVELGEFIVHPWDLSQSPHAN